MTRETLKKWDTAAIWRWLLAGYWLALVIGTHLPSRVPGLPVDHVDKLAHFAAYAGLSWLLAMTWEQSTGRLTRRHLQWAWLAIVLFGAIDELTQSFVGRTSSFGDWLANGVGSALGLLIFAAWRSK